MIKAKKTAQKLVALFLLGAISFSVAACGGGETSSSVDNSSEENLKGLEKLDHDLSHTLHIC